jgi:hypothetical protein
MPQRGLDRINHLDHRLEHQGLDTQEHG